MNIYTATEEAYKRGLEDGKPKWISVKERLPEDESDCPGKHLCHPGNNGLVEWMKRPAEVDNG